MSPPSRQAGSRATAAADDALKVITVCGKRVTMIDDARKVFVIDLLSSEECDEIRTMTDSHVRNIIQSGSDEETWRTLYTYTKMDLPIVEVKDLGKRYTDQILHDVKKIVAELFGRKDAMKLRPRSWKEPHLLLYQRLEDRPAHSGIEMHYDGCDITCELSFEIYPVQLCRPLLICVANKNEQGKQCSRDLMNTRVGGHTFALFERRKWMAWTRRVLAAFLPIDFTCRLQWCFPFLQSTVSSFSRVKCWYTQVGLVLSIGTLGTSRTAQ